MLFQIHEAKKKNIYSHELNADKVTDDLRHNNNRQGPRVCAIVEEGQPDSSSDPCEFGAGMVK